MAINKKLLEFQRLGITLVRTGVNPHFNSSYVTLNEVLDKVKEPLNKLGILILQTSERDGLRTVLQDTEDETKIECFMPYTETSTAQKLGSNLTYLRRYSLVTLLGLEDSDDDGNEASKAPQARHSAPQRNEATPSANITPAYGVDPRVPIVTQDTPVGDFAYICSCGLKKKRVQTKKAGPNQGRWFWACPKPQGQQCPNNFVWDDMGDGENRDDYTGNKEDADRDYAERKEASK